MAAGMPDGGDEGDRADREARDAYKRRHVVGRRYGISTRRRLLYWVISIVVIAAVIFGIVVAVDAIDDRRIALEPTAPWAQAGAPETPPRPIDYMRNGPTDTIPRAEIAYPPVTPLSDRR